MPTGEDPFDSAEDKQRLARFRVLDLSAVGLAFPISLLIGYFAGRFVGGWLGNAQLGALIGALLGLAGGFYNLFKMVSRLAPRGTPPAGGSTVANSVGPTGAAALGAARPPGPADRERRLSDPPSDSDAEDVDLEKEALEWLEDDDAKPNAP